MMHRCAICGRPTSPFAVIGSEVVGPKCAKRAGLVPSRMPKGSKVKFAKSQPVPKDDCQTMDLFEGLE